MRERDEHLSSFKRILYSSASEMGFRGTLGFRDAFQGFREAFRNLKKKF